MERLSEAAQALKDASHSERSVVANAQAQRLGMSRATLYRRLAKAGLYQSGRKQRSDAGTIRKEGVTEEALKLAAAAMITSKRNTGTIEMPAEDAILRLEANRLIEPGLISADMLRRHMRRMQLDARSQLAATPHQDLRSLHPNHAHQMDPSVCLQWYFDDKGKGTRERDMVATVYKNKPDELAKAAGKKTRKILRYVLTDHYSGHIHVRYFYETGEKATTAIDFLIDAWLPKENGSPFHGVPQILIWDQGTANTGHAPKAFLEALDVEVITHTPHNARAKGQVENANYIVQRSFEAGLRISPATDLEELNRKAAQWSLWFNSKKLHGRHRMTRAGCWQMIRPEHLRVPQASSDLLRNLATHPVVTRKIKGDYSITFGRDDAGAEIVYRLHTIDGMAPGMTIEVQRNVFKPDAVRVRIHSDEPWVEVERVQMMAPMQGGFAADAAIIGQERKSMPGTEAMRAGKEVDRLTYGSSTDKEAEAARRRGEKPLAGVDAHKHFTDYKAPEYMRRRGTDMPIAAAPEVAPKSGVTLMKILTRRLSRALTPEENAAIKAEYPNGMTDDQIETWLRGPVEKPTLRAVS